MWMWARSGDSAARPLLESIRFAFFLSFILFGGRLRYASRAVFLVDKASQQRPESYDVFFLSPLVRLMLALPCVNVRVRFVWLVRSDGERARPAAVAAVDARSPGRGVSATSREITCFSGRFECVAPHAARRPDCVCVCVRGRVPCAAISCDRMCVRGKKPLAYFRFNGITVSVRSLRPRRPMKTNFFLSPVRRPLAPGGTQ